MSQVVGSVKQQYAHSLNNSWVFGYLDGLVNKLQPAKAEGVGHTRERLEAGLRMKVDEKLGIVQTHVPEIKTEDVYELVITVGNLYELVCSRAEAELSCLEPKSTQYSDAEQLVNAEFDKSRAFASEDEHRKWLADVLGNLEAIFDYSESIGNILSNKSGFGWLLKISAAKVYLQHKLGINLEVSELAEDVSIAKQAVIGSYQKYEEELMRRRYS